MATPTGSPDGQSLFYHGSSAAPSTGDFVAFHVDASNFQIDSGDSLYGVTPSITQPQIFSAWLPAGGTASADYQLRISGQDQSESFVSGGSVAVSTDPDFAFLGAGNPTPAGSPQNFWNGTVAEVIAYDAGLDATSRSRIESYLAVKYGTTLDQASPQNYVSSDGTVIWDATANVDLRQ